MKKIFKIFSALFLCLPVTVSVVSCQIGKDELDQLIDIDNTLDINNPDNEVVFKAWKTQAQKMQDNFTASLYKDWKKEYQSIRTALKEKYVLNIDQNVGAPISVKSELTDGVHLGLEPFGQYAPKISELHEVERIEIPNFTALNKAGYTLYVTKNDEDNILELININQQDQISMSDDQNNQSIYTAVENNGNDYLLFKSKSNTTSKDAGKTVSLNFIAKNKSTGEILETISDEWKRNSVTITFDKSYGDSEFDFTNYKMGDWFRYQYVTNENFICYEITPLLLTYYNAVINYMNQLVMIKEQPQFAQKRQIVPGWNSIQSSEKFTEDTEASTIYYAYRFNATFDYFTILMDDGNLVPLLLNQGQEFAVPFPELEKVTNDLSNRKRLTFNPWYEFSDKVKKFIAFIWGKILYMNHSLDEKYAVIGK